MKTHIISRLSILAVIWFIVFVNLTACVGTAVFAAAEHTGHGKLNVTDEEKASYMASVSLDDLGNPNQGDTPDISRTEVPDNDSMNRVWKQPDYKGKRIYLAWVNNSIRSRRYRR